MFQAWDRGHCQSNSAGYSDVLTDYKSNATTGTQRHSPTYPVTINPTHTSSASASTSASIPQSDAHQSKMSAYDQSTYTAFETQAKSIQREIDAIISTPPFSSMYAASLVYDEQSPRHPAPTTADFSSLKTYTTATNTKLQDLQTRLQTLHCQSQSTAIKDLEKQYGNSTKEAQWEAKINQMLKDLGQRMITLNSCKATLLEKDPYCTF